MPALRCMHRENGLSMLEVLITIVVISFGLLGVAGLQITGLKNNQMSYSRSIATFQAYDMADRMRANMTGVNAGNYDAITNTAYVDPGCANPATATGGCTPAQIATYDASVWHDANTKLLPGGGGTVTKIVVAPGISAIFDISVFWTEKCVSGETGCSSSGTLTRTFTTEFVP